MAETTKRFQLHTDREGEAVGMERLRKLERSEAFLSLEEDNNVFTKMLISLVGEFLSFGTKQICSLYHGIKLNLHERG